MCYSSIRKSNKYSSTSLVSRLFQTCGDKSNVRAQSYCVDSLPPSLHTCAPQLACCSPSAEISPALLHVPDGNKLTNQKAAASCRTKTKQFSSCTLKIFYTKINKYNLKTLTKEQT